VADEVVKRPAYSNGDTSFYSILHCNDMESVATSLLNRGGPPFEVLSNVVDQSLLGGEYRWSEREHFRCWFQL
jgi:hypothetical protein